jgi:hypothetical protein
MSKKRIKLVKLLTDDGKIISKTGWVDFTSGVYDDEGKIYAAGFDETGTVHGTSGNAETGEILYEDGSSTGYNIKEDYFSLVCLKIAYSNPIKKTA